jgi:hypothetical protein
MKIERSLGVVAALFLASAGPVLTKPVEFEFVAPDNAAVANPYSRELWAEVFTPAGQKLTLPAYYADGGLYAVHARPDEVGTYRFGAVSETTLGIRRTGLVVSLVTPSGVDVAARTRLPSVAVDPANPRQFIRSDGVPYVPVGANLAWRPGGTADTLAYYRGAFPAFARANLNWMRVWMAHWDGLNLDWLPPSMGPSPRPGGIDEGVAETWDGIVQAAEDSGVYVQLVLQHHGQYTTADNSNWAENPWNAANPGGFLKSPEDFFTDPNARVITLLKYRYIVARWGWSPAIVAWELFNEVHWTDSFRHGHEADVASWHTAAANYIRLVDVYGHMITTSTENIRSPIYEKMDYYQPHLYASNMLAAARTFTPELAALTKPAFYGEEGDDHQAVPDEAKKAGTDIVPPIWASVMGQGTLAAEPWHGWEILDQHRESEVGAVFRFLALNRVASQPGLVPFSAVVETRDRIPLRILAGQFWQRRAAPDIYYPLNGAEVTGAADIPSTLVGSAGSRSDGFPDAESYVLDVPRAVTMTAHVDSSAPAGGTLEASVDGVVVATHAWTAADPVRLSSSLAIPVPAGHHGLTLRDTGPDWLGVSGIDTGLVEPVLGLIGRRSDHFIEAWVWNRRGLYDLAPPVPISGTVNLEGVPAGSWRVTWWDTLKGAPMDPSVLTHPGGTLKLQTPPIARHAAVVLVRLP